MPGEKVCLILDNDYPLAWANNRDELVYLLDALKEKGIHTAGKSLWATPNGIQ
ncbi:MAG: hypothetical protein MZV70_28155 [Desulfobacterales bacterium]|nr:hypothetical protein [Desulfobacterales bacterium]